MAVEEALPARPPSAFGSRHATVGKDGRRLGGATTESYHEQFWTDERREAQRQKMLQLHAEGKMGGQNGFHRRRTKKAQEILAEKTQAKADEIWEKLWAMIQQSKDKRLQLEAIRELAKMEDWAVKNSREDEKEFRNLSGAQLNALLLERMGDALGVDFGSFLQQPVDGEVVAESYEIPAVTHDPCEACDEERDRVVDLMRDAGVTDLELLLRSGAAARCHEHRETAREEVAV